jgi:hypothetical protein
MKRRKKKWPKGKRPKIHQGGVVNKSQRLKNVDDVISKVELVGRIYTTRLVDANDPYDLSGRF